MARWKILRGVHGDKNAKPVELVDKPGVERMEGDGIFYAGDVIETDVDLSKCNTSPQTKFTKLDDPPDPGPYAELDEMSVKQLQDLAKQEDIDLPTTLKKAQMVLAIRGALTYNNAVL